MLKKLFVLFVIVLLIPVFTVAFENLYISGETNSRLISKKGGLAAVFELGLDRDKDVIADTGNIIYPNRFTFHDNGKKVVELYKKAGYLFSVLSNHDFDFGLKNMRQLKKTIELISTNYTGVDPYVIKEFNGMKIGFLGLTLADLDLITKCDVSKEYSPKETLKSIQDTVRELEDRCDHIILLSNESMEKTIDVTRKITDIDHVFVVSSSDYDSMIYKKITLKNNSIVHLIPVGFTHIYKSVIDQENGLSFELMPLPEASSEMITGLKNMFPKQRVIEIDDRTRLVNKSFTFLSQKTDADVVIFNRGIINPETRILSEFIKYDGDLHLISVKGSDLKAALSQDSFYFFGVENGKIHDRKIINDHHYKVLINDYTYNGGDGFDMRSEMIKKNIIKSYKNLLAEEYHQVVKSKKRQKKYLFNKNQFFLSYSQLDLAGNAAQYSGVPELSGTEKEDYMFEYRNDLKKEGVSRSFTNYTEFSYEKTDGVNNVRSLLIQSTYDIKDKKLVFFQKINTSLLDNANGDKTTNYRLSIGKMLEKELYAGLSYQQMFPEEDADANYGLQLTWDSPVSLDKGVLWKRYFDLFYSKTGDEYYEAQFKTSFSIPFYKKFNLEMSYDKFLVYDDIIGDDAGNSKYFLGVNYSFKTEDFTR